MQLYSTFGAFLVAFTMVNGAPILPESEIDPAISMRINPPTMDSAYKFPVGDETAKPEMKDGVYGNRRPMGIIARDPKKSQPKGKSNELAKAKGAEVGKNAVTGLKTILDDKLDSATKNCTRTDKKLKEDTKDDEKSPFAKLFNDDKDEEEPSDEECEDLEGDEAKEEEPSVDKRDLPPGFASAKRGPTGTKGGSSSKPPKSDDSKGGPSIGQDILTQTTSNVISDGIWYGVDQATAQDARVKRGAKGGKGGSSSKPPGGQSDEGSSIGQDILTQTTSNVISDGIWYGVDQAVAGDAPAKRSPRGGRLGQAGKDILADVVSDGISSGIWYGVDQATAESQPAKRSPRGGRLRQGGKDVLTDVVPDGISTGIWYGVDEATNEKRSSPSEDKLLDKFGGLQIDTDDFSDLDWPLSCAGTGCSGVQPDTNPVMDEPRAGGIQKRDRSRNKGSPKTSPSSGGSRAPPSNGGGSSTPANGGSSSGGDPNNGSGAGAGSGFVQGAKDTAKDMTQDIVTDAASGAIVAGIEAALVPAETAAPVPPPAKRALRFSA